MQLIYDPDLNVAYIRLRVKRAKVTTIVVSDELNVDIGPDGKVYGIELLNANQQLGSKKVKTLLVENTLSGKKVSMAIAG
jgi:uncharacterized protein YuzE